MADTEDDPFVPDPVVCKEFGVTSMTLYRWDHDPAKAAQGWPVKYRIGNRNYRLRSELETYKANLRQRALAERQRALAERGGE
jgi:hypothetical protein